MSSEDVNTLIEMGFTKLKAERALTVTGNQGVEPAMEWLLAHSGEMEENNLTTEPSPQPEPSQSQPSTLVLTPKPEPEQEPKEDESASSEVNSEESSEAKSLKCDACGRLFKSQLEVEFHAAKSGHSSFSESAEEKKPLTEEEKKEQLKMIEEKLKQKRKEREEKEKVEALEREKHRIQSGKEISAAKKKLEEEEMKKLVDQRKREKEEERMARERVKAQIEADKAARRAKQSGVEQPPPPVQTQPINHSNATPARDYAQTKIQIRLTNGQALTQTFGVKEQLSAVRLYVEMNRTDGSDPFSLMTNFPKKIFNDEDYEKPLDILGLVPSAVLIVSRGMLH